MMGTCTQLDHIGDYTFELLDARGIYCGRVCEYCEERVKASYRPEVFSDGNYECDEPIEPEDYWGTRGENGIE